MPALMAAWHFSKAEARLIATSSLLAAALGGWTSGILSDRHGRARVLTGPIIWSTAFSIIIAGFTNAYHQSLIVRALQGLGFGAEGVVGAALMAEGINLAHRGKALGLVQSGFSVGWALAAVITGLLLVSACVHRMALGVLGRRCPRARRAADSPLHPRARDIPRNEAGDGRRGRGDVAFVVPRGCPPIRIQAAGRHGRARRRREVRLGRAQYGSALIRIASRFRPHRCMAVVRPLRHQGAMCASSRACRFDGAAQLNITVPGCSVHR
ncbi:MULTISPECIES: MFS transporter [Caballeronia]|uniref:MFS transporter n=1 Tax=Caballeronia jiangsuensis TaxID=1458357 RepID=A0ABW9CVJ8_9BURK|nr:MFS transporter [Caballeronia sp. GaOx3]